MSLTVEHYTASRINNPNPAGETPYEVFWEVYEAIEVTCRRYARVGPFDREPDLWLVADQYNSELYHYLQIHKRSLGRPELLIDLAKTLRHFPGWGIGISNIRFAYLLIFESKLMVTGWPFARCNDVEAVADALSRSLDGINGESPVWTDQTYHRNQLLNSAQCGCYTCCQIFPPEAIEEWTDVDKDGVLWTALCPHCQSKTVIAPAQSKLLNLSALIELSESAFGPLALRGITPQCSQIAKFRSSS